MKVSDRWKFDRPLNTVLKKPPQADGLSVKTVQSLGLVEVNGVLLTTTSGTGVAVTKDFELGSIAYRRKLAAHRRRIRKEEARLKKMREEEKKLPKIASRSEVTMSQMHLPFKINPKDLKVVSCAKCKKTLLAECLEYIRKDAEEFKMKAVANLPPPVCARLFGSRPYCSDCVQDLLDNDQVTERIDRPCLTSSSHIQSPIQSRPTER